MTINVDQNRIEIILKEYEALKAEIKYFFNMQFTLIGFWLVFISALVGYIFSRIDIGNEQESTPFFIYLILIVLIPGVCDVLGLIWLDFSTRVVKAAHYIFIIENRLMRMFDEEDYVLGWEHYVFADSQRGKKLENLHNYFYYFFMLGIFFIAPPVLCLFTAHYTGWICDMDKIFILLFFVIETVTVLFSVLYIRRISSYSDEKKKMLGIKSNNTFKIKLKKILKLVLYLVILILYVCISWFTTSNILNYMYSLLSQYNITLYIWFEIIINIIVTIVIFFIFFMNFLSLLMEKYFGCRIK